MKRCLMKIELLSDLCVSDGGVYNSTLDTDICHDEYGFPFIPGKRIKGCLRECAQELRDWGMQFPVPKDLSAKDASEDVIDIMFGKRIRGGKGSERLRIGNAYLEHYNELKKMAVSVPENVIFHPQNILDHFSYMRTQTGINYETGASDPTTLRTIRVANKGLVFIAEIEFQDEYSNVIEDCCSTLTNMGIARTRGLGEVQVSLLPQKVPGGKDTSAANDTLANNEKKHASYLSGSSRLEYELYLEEPVICKSVNGGEAKTLDYIEGSKLLGLIAQGMDQQEFLRLMEEGELFCSNAYIEQCGKRCTEIPATFYSVKNDDSRYINKVYSLTEDLKNKPMTAIKHCYISEGEKDQIYKTEVRLEERYHHRRPEDKSIGRALENGVGGSQFYQLSSIEAGQTFRGYMIGTEGQIKKIYDDLSDQTVFYLGYGRSSEYGKSRIRITKTRKTQATRAVAAKEWIVKLEAPALIYNDRAFYSTDGNDLVAEVNALLGLDLSKVKVERYLNYTTVGGYNVTWGRRKPTMEAFDKGSVLHYHAEDSVNLELPEVLLIGERISEGFGEAIVQVIEPSENRLSGSIIKKGNEPEEQEKNRQTAVERRDMLDLKTYPMASELCDSVFREFIQMEGTRQAGELLEKYFSTLVRMEEIKKLVGKILLTCQQESDFEEIYNMYYEETERDKQKKSQKERDKPIVNSILEDIKEGADSALAGFCKTYNVAGYQGFDGYRQLYLAAVLRQLRYAIRKSEESVKDGKKEEA